MATPVRASVGSKTSPAPVRDTASSGALPDPTRRRRVTIAVGAGVVALVAVVLATQSTGEAQPSPLLDPGAVVRWGVPVVGTLAHIAALVTVGAFVCCATVINPDVPRTRGLWSRAAHIGVVAAVAWTLLQTAALVLNNAEMLGQPLSTINAMALLDYISNTWAGGVQAWSVLLTGWVAILAVLATTQVGAAWAFVAAVIALVPAAGAGHGAGGLFHTVAVSAMWLHLIGIGIWVGGLLMLMLVGGGRMREMIARYSTIAGWGFAIVLVSGVLNAVVRLNTPTELLSTGWGQLVLVKSVSFIALGLAGYTHREYVLKAWHDQGPGGNSRALFWRLAGVELAIMGAIVGVSVSLGSTTPPIPDQPAGDVFIELTGQPAPPALSPGTLLTQWHIEPVLLVAALAAAVVYLRWVQRLAQRGDDWPVWRTLSWLAGMALFVWTTSGGLAAYAYAQFSAHMAQHMLLMTFLPILYVLAAPATLALRALPRRTDGSMGPREYLLGIMHSGFARFLTHPVVAALNVVVSMAAFYLTGLFEFSLTSHVAHVLMVVHFSAAGFIFVNILIGTDPGFKRPFFPLRLLLLLPSMVFHTFFGLALVSSSTLIAAPYYARLQAPWVEDLLADQQIGGAIAWVLGELPVLGFAVVIAMAWVRADALRQQREQRQAQRTARAQAASGQE